MNTPASVERQKILESREDDKEEQKEQPENVHSRRFPLVHAFSPLLIDETTQNTHPGADPLFLADGISENHAAERNRENGLHLGKMEEKRSSRPADLATGWFPHIHPFKRGGRDPRPFIEE